MSLKSPLYFIVVLVFLGLSACSSDKDKCEPSDTRLCLDGILYSLNSCMEPETLLEHCECGCTLDASDCVLCPSCTASSCSGHGSCDDSSGTAVCTCHTGYAGDRCLDCADGYRAVEGECVEAAGCTPDTCSGHGDCDDSSGVPVCTCDSGYQGDRCQTSEGAVGYLSVSTSRREVNEGGQIFVMEHYTASAFFSTTEQLIQGESIGPCIMPPDPDPPRRGSTLDAGTVSISGGTAVVSLNTEMNQESQTLVYDRVYESELLFSGGETLTFSAPGMAGGGPAFSETLTAPYLAELATLDGSPYPGPQADVVFDPSSDHVFTWPAGGEGQMVILLRPDPPYYWRNVTCSFDLSAGSGTIPAAVFQHFQQVGLDQMDSYVKLTKQVQADGFDLTISASFEGGDVRNALIQ